MDHTIAVIMGGGQGTRLYPLTKHRSKPAVPLAGKYRLIDIPISNCINSGIRKIFVLTQFNSESLNRHVTHAYRFDNFSRGFVEILAAEQTFDSHDWFQGTADAVRKGFRHFASYNPQYIMILSGDQLYKMDYREFIAFHEEKEAEVTVATIPVAAEDASSFGIMRTDRDLRINDFVEKPSEDQLPLLSFKASEVKGLPPHIRARIRAKPLLASMGIYLFNTAVLEKMLAEQECLDFGKHLIPKAIRKRKVFSYPFDGYWSDIGTIKSFFMANLDLTRANSAFNLYDVRSPTFTHPRFLPATKIFQCQISSSIISDGCVLSGALIWNSIIGIRSRIGNGTEIRESLIMGADYYEDRTALNLNRKEGRPDIGIGNFCTIRRAILDKNVRVGNNVRILNRHNEQDFECDQYVIRDGIVIIPKNTVVPDNTVI
ncbi:MAG: glucose-1-phosphate adenylyltransferase [Acidobacteria bacterium]|nr:glucose-1-phosphate adenylyltransferase [Acidobacteriota bacterium]